MLEPAVVDFSRAKFAKNINDKKRIFGTGERQLASAFGTSILQQAKILLKREAQILRGFPAPIIIRYISFSFRFAFPIWLLFSKCI
jgi:hypothetical protein